MIDYETKRRESILRRIAKKQGFAIHKSKCGLSINNQGGYTIINSLQNAIEAGEHFELSLDDIEKFLK